MRLLLLLEWLKNFVLLAIAMVMIVLGAAMILVPAPPSFEILTLYYFNPNDGITVMDLVSLIIVFGGIYLFLATLIRMINLYKRTRRA